MLGKPTPGLLGFYDMDNATNRYLDAVKVALDITSDNKLAAYLGVSRQRLTQYRRGDNDLSDERCLDFACILKIQPENILLEIQAERAAKAGKSDVSAVFASVLRRIKSDPQAALFSLFAVSLGLCFAPYFFSQNDLFYGVGIVSFYLSDNANYAKYTALNSLILGMFLFRYQCRISGAFCHGFDYTLSLFLLHDKHGNYYKKTPLYPSENVPPARFAGSLGHA